MIEKLIENQVIISIRNLITQIRNIQNEVDLEVKIESQSSQVIIRQNKKHL